MKFLFFLIFVLLLFVGCNIKSDFENNITDNGDVFWSYKSSRYDQNTPFAIHYKFFTNGNFKIFNAKNDNERGDEQVSIWMDRVETGELPKWSFKIKDSTFSLGHPQMTFKVIKYSKDTIIMEGKGFEGKFALIRIDLSHKLPLNPPARA